MQETFDSLVKRKPDYVMGSEVFREDLEEKEGHRTSHLYILHFCVAGLSIGRVGSLRAARQASSERLLHGRDEHVCCCHDVVSLTRRDGSLGAVVDRNFCLYHIDAPHRNLI